MSKKLRIIALTLIISVVFLLPSCRPATKESVDISTTLSLDDSFSGSRTIVLTFPQSVVEQGSDMESNLDKVVQKYCPDSMNYAKNSTDGKISYSFNLKFESKYEYEEKTSDICASKTVVSFSNPSTVMARGWKIEESFQSSELISWIKDGAEKESFPGFDFETSETQTNVILNGDIQSSQPMIHVNCLDGSPVQKIQIKTVNQKSVFDRTIAFTVSQSTFDSLKDSITDYFSNATDKAAASADWILENNSYIYTVRFNDVTMKELSGYTNKLLNTVYGEVSYRDKSVGSTALAEQNSYTETLDFSSYIGNDKGNVPIEYTYSVDGSSELSECQIYDGSEWKPAIDLLDTNQYGHVSAIKSTSSYIQLRINDGKQYTASSIDVISTPLEDNKLKKSIVFKYDIATGGNEASDYTKEYFQNLNIGAVQSVEGGKNTCTVTFSGTPEELNAKLPSIFGDKNIVKYSSQNQFMMLRTMKHFSDYIDFSSLIIGKNVDTPVYYSLAAENGDIIKTLRFTVKDPETSAATETVSDLSRNENGIVSMQLTAPDAAIEFDISTPNVTEIIFCSVLAFIAILISVVLIFVFRSRKSYIGLGSGGSASGLPGGSKELSVKNETSLKRKKDGK